MGELLTQDDTCIWDKDACMWDKDAWCHTEEWELNLNISHILQHTIACRSTWGFQSLSYKITISAVAKLIPRTPALVLNMKINFHFQACYMCIDYWLSLLMQGLSIQMEVLKSFPQTVIFKDVQHSGHLRENQNSRTFRLKPHKQLLGVKESINLSTNQSVYIVSQSISPLVN